MGEYGLSNYLHARNTYGARLNSVFVFTCEQMTVWIYVTPADAQADTCLKDAEQYDLWECSIK